MIGNNPQTNRSFKSGAPAFTLVELLLVMVLLTIVVSVSMPMLSSFFRARSLDNEARRLLALTRHAQSLAVSGGMPMVVWFDERKRSYGMEEDSAYENDKNSIYFYLDKDVDMEVVQIKRQSAISLNNFTGNRGRFSSTPIVAQPNNQHRNNTSIRFLEDGTVAESSPEMIRFKGRSVNDVTVLAQIRPRVSANENRPKTEIRSQGYEIRTATNQWDEADLYR
jgi:type II secretion system protein H